MQLLLEMFNIDQASAVDIASFFMWLLALGIFLGLMLHEAFEGLCLMVYYFSQFSVRMLKKLLNYRRAIKKERKG